MDIFRHPLTFLFLIVLPVHLFGQTIREASGLGANPELRVLIQSELDTVKIFTNSPLKIESQAGIRMVDSGATVSILQKSGELRGILSGGFFQVPDSLRISLSDSSGFINVNGTQWRGFMILYPDSAGIQVINRVRLNDYLLSVVPAEIGKGRKQEEMEAVRVQAIIARTFTLQRVLAVRKKTGKWDLTAGMADQVYQGVKAEVPSYSGSIEETNDLVIVSDSLLIQSLYHSTCGGSTNDPMDVWGNGRFSYLMSVNCGPGKDPQCKISPFFSWKRDISFQQIAKNLAAPIPRVYQRRMVWSGAGSTLSTFLNMEIMKRNQNLVTEIKLVGSERDLLIQGDAMRWVCRDSSGRLLPSQKFTVNKAFDDSGQPILIFEGTGYGHGVGLCQWGAIASAQKGRNFMQIISDYYSQTTVIKLPH